MKFSQLAKGDRSVKTVQFRLGNAPVPSAPLPPDAALPNDEWTAVCGVRTLTGEETALVYSSARKDAFEKGVKDWLDADPICRLYEQAHTVALACVDVDSPGQLEPFFVGGVEEVLKSPSLGQDNIALLYAEQAAWQDEVSLKVRDLTFEEVLAVLHVEANRPENAESPLVRMRPAMQRTFLRTTAKLFQISAKGRLLSMHTGDGDGSSTSTSSASATPSADAEPPPDVVEDKKS